MHGAERRARAQVDRDRGEQHARAGAVRGTDHVAEVRLEVPVHALQPRIVAGHLPVEERLHATPLAAGAGILSRPREEELAEAAPARGQERPHEPAAVVDRLGQRARPERPDHLVVPHVDHEHGGPLLCDLRGDAPDDLRVHRRHGRVHDLHAPARGVLTEKDIERAREPERRLGIARRRRLAEDEHAERVVASAGARTAAPRATARAGRTAARNPGSGSGPPSAAARPAAKKVVGVP